MAEMEEGLRDAEQQEEEQPWVERTRRLQDRPRALREEGEEKVGKKHKVKWIKRPMVMPQAILEFLDEDLGRTPKGRRNPDDYYQAGLLVFNSCATMSVLLQVKMMNETLNVRSIKHLANVLTLFQASFLLYVGEALTEIISDISSLGRGIKTADFEFQIAMHILEAIPHDAFGISIVCNPICDHLLGGLIEAWDKQESPEIMNQMHQLLLNVGKLVEHPILRDPVQVHAVKEKMLKSGTGTGLSMLYGCYLIAVSGW
ncbi:CCR4-NOT transcription complex subunit 9 [Cocos nucifera]|nr:CCR4-NOT transcription complex subunit 9 [Cocos nucifera]